MALSNDSNTNGMEVDNEDINDSSVFTNSATPSFLVSLHPLVIMNISEHWTRTRAQNDGNEKNEIKVFGALIGKQKGRDIEIMNSFELKFDKVGKDHVFDKEYYGNKETQFKQVFPDLDFLGWYANGGDPTREEIAIHSQMIQIQESPLFLKLNPLATQVGLPIKIFESVVDIVNGNQAIFFVNVPYSVVTEEAERIGLDHMARLTSTTQTGDKTVSVVVEHLRVQYNAVKMLRDRIKLLSEYVKDTKNKQIPVNNEILRTISNLSARLFVLNSDGFHQDFYTQCNDVALITHLGTLTKCTNILNQFINKFNITIDRHPSSRRTKML